VAFRAATLAAMLGVASPAVAGETPKYGGSLIFMIPADAPPSFDALPRGHLRDRPFGRTLLQLIRVDPNNPSSTTDFVWRCW
jgi:peptide/nickel transport system substrate-binding protein